MKITNLKAAGLKGRTFNHNLKGVNIFTGPNFAGKTSRIDAAVWALSGYLPSVGKQNGALFEMASGTAMDVWATISDGAVLHRGLKLDRKGSVKYEDSGNMLELPPVLLDPNEYFGLKTDEARVKYMFDNVRLSGDGFSLHDLLAKIKSVKAEEHTARHEVAIADIAEEVSVTFQGAIQEGKTVQESLAEVLDNLTLRKLTADQEVKRMAGTVQGISQLAGARDITANPEQLETDYKAAQAQAAQLAQSIRTVTEQITTEEGRAARGKSLSAQLAALPSATAIEGDLAYLPGALVRRDTLKKLIDSMGAIEARRTQIEPKIAAWTQAKSADLDAIEKTMAELKTDVDNYQSGTQDAKLADAKAEADLQTLMRDYQRTTETIATGEKGIKEVMAETCCPYCKTKRQGWQESILAEWQDKRAGLQVELNNLRASIEVAEDKISDTKKAVENAMVADQHIKNYRVRLLDLQTKASVLTIERDQAERLLAELRGLQASHPEDLAALRLEYQTIGTEIALRIGTVDPAQRLIELTRQDKDRNRIEADLRAMPAPMDVDELRAKVVTSQSELTRAQSAAQALGEQYKLAVAALADARSQAEAEEAWQKVKAESEVAGMVKDLIQAEKSKMVEKVFHKLLAVANRLCEPILRSPLAYHDGRLGRWEKTKFVGWKTFSGCEKALAFAAMSIALAVDAPIKIVMLDELGRLGRDNVRQLVMLAEKLVDEGVLDQFIGIDTDADRYAAMPSNGEFQLIAVE